MSVKRTTRSICSLAVLGTMLTAGIVGSAAGTAQAGSNAAAPGADGMGYYNQNDGSFHLRNALNAGSSDYPFVYGPAGNTGVYPVTGDWDGDGETSVGFFRQSDGSFHLTNDLTSPRSFSAFQIGVTGPGIIPVAGDWDGDGEDTVGWFRQSDGSFHLYNDLLAGSSDVSFQFGPTGPGVYPVAGDWDGNKRDSVGYFQQSNGSFHLRNALSGGASDAAFTYAPAATDTFPIAGDWNGDGKDSVGWYKRSDAGYHLRNALSGGSSDVSFSFGPTGTNVLPVAGQWYAPPTATPPAGPAGTNPYGASEVSQGWTPRMQFVIDKLKAAQPAAAGACGGQANGTQSGHISNSDHYSGNAADCRQSSAYGTLPNATQKATADTAAQWLVDNASGLKVKYVIWYGRIWTPSQGWHAYCHKAASSCSPSSASNITLNHYDHIHISEQH